MRKTNRMLYTIVVALLIFGSCSNPSRPTSAGAAPPDVEQAPAKTDSPRNIQIKDASSPYEDLVEFALNGDEAGMDKAVSQIETGWETLKPLIRSNQQADIQRLIDSIKAQRAAKKYNAVAMDAVVAYSFIVKNLDESELLVPVAVSMLDYVGFRLLVLTSASNVDWENVRSTVEQGVKEWKKIEPTVKKDKALYNTVVVAVEGMQDAAQKKNLDMMRFAAKVDLEVVDLLEHFFEK